MVCENTVMSKSCSLKYFRGYASTFIAIFLLELVNPCIAADHEQWVLISDSSRKTMWQVFSDGNINRIKYPFYENLGNSGIYFYPAYPVPSPDQRQAAFTKNNDVWVYRLDEDKEYRLTNIGKPEDDKYASVYAGALTWSPDSKKILYHVSEGFTGAEEGPSLKERLGIPYGRHIYDLEKNKSYPVKIPTRPEDVPVWLPNGEFLIFAEGATSYQTDNELHRYNPNTGESLPVIPDVAWYSRPDVSSDGKWALVSAGQKPEGTIRSQIRKINLETGKVIDITPLGDWTEYSAPTLSPSGRHVAYQWRIEYKPSDSKRVIVVDGRKIYSYVGYASTYWINDSVILVSTRKEFVVIDIKTGKIKGQQKK